MFCQPGRVYAHLRIQKMGKPRDSEKEARALGARVRIFRKLKGLSREELAAAVRRTKSAIDSIEQGVTTPGADVIREMCRKYGASADWVLCGRFDVAPFYAESGEQVAKGAVWDAAVDISIELSSGISKEVEEQLRRKGRERSFVLPPDPVEQARVLRAEIERQRARPLLSPAGRSDTRAAARVVPNVDAPEESVVDRFRMVLVRLAGNAVPASTIERLVEAAHHKLGEDTDLEALARRMLDAELRAPRPGQVANVKDQAEKAGMRRRKDPKGGRSR